MADAGAIPLQVWEIFKPLRNEITWLHGRWKCYEQMFRKTERRVQMLNRCASTAVYIIQDTLFDEIVLGLARITESGAGLLTIGLLQRRLDSGAHHTLATRNQRVYDSLVFEEGTN